MAAQELQGAEDALFVLTAAMLTPGCFPGVLGDDYPAACGELGLEPLEAGYGLVFGQDGTGARWTVATTDVAAVACALAAWDCGLEYDLSPDGNSVAASLPGWPLPVAVAVPGVPDPYDPDEDTGGRPPLAPPDASAWGPAQRRAGADEIAVRWREWRDQFPAEENAAVPGSAAGGGGGQDGGEDGIAGSAGAAAAPAGPSHGGVRGALADAEGYLRDTPPAGRVRAAHGAVRADGPGWSLVARTGDMAFVLLDEAPGEVLPVGRGPSLPALLEALGRLAGIPDAAAQRTALREAATDEAVRQEAVTPS
ncbi:hypothetical protein [Actinacidiphila sp. ITFR-21]|uniref:hypothetical protein n=1 Tax=Actinacidiphila sp. ITFR-21 TaxID=3075199 RepID=UPI002889D069|nr:hypothetical protein [Streptomyces sp. ITFR-21]WNI19084.1 hypothetical protein RLT57_28500 [Streptomyces sp. ITFR-21]